jgi:hypothetical protein
VVIKTDRSDLKEIKKILFKNQQPPAGGLCPFQGPSSYPQLVVADSAILGKLRYNVNNLSI